MKKVLLMYGTFIINEANKTVEVQDLLGQLWVNEDNAEGFGASLIENEVCDSFIIPALITSWSITLNIKETIK